MRNLSDFLINTSEGSNIKFYLISPPASQSMQQSRKEAMGLKKMGFFLKLLVLVLMSGMLVCSVQGDAHYYDFVVSITLTLACFDQNPRSLLLLTLYIASLFDVL